MKFIEYSDGDSVNVKTLDDDHEKIVHSLNKLYEFLSSNNFNKFKKELEYLRDLSLKHFEKENHLMITHKDPGYFSHQYEHSRISREINNGLNNALNHPENISLEFLNMLKRWFENHLILKDKKLGKYLNSKGVY